MTTEISAKQQSAIERAVQHPELEVVLFRKAKGVKWFDAFERAGFFAPENNPRPIEQEDGTFQVPGWPVLEYLENTASELGADDVEFSRKILSVITRATEFSKANNFGNYRTWWQFSKILASLDAQNLRIDDLSIIPYWLDDQFERGLVGQQLLEWLKRLLNDDHESSRALSRVLLDQLIQVEFSERQVADTARILSRLKLRAFNLEREIGPIAYQAGSVLKGYATGLFIDRLCLVLAQMKNDRWSSIWRPAIEEHEQNSRPDGAEDFLLIAVREAISGLLSFDANDGIVELRNVLASQYITLRRIGIFASQSIIGEIDEPTLRLILDLQNFSTHTRHEMWHFLNSVYARLNDDLKGEIIQKITSVTEVHEEDGSVDDRATAYQRSLWLSAIKDKDETAKQFYQQCVAITEVDPENPDFSTYFSSGWVSHESPLSTEELLVLFEDPVAFVRVMNEYQHQGNWNEPDLEGLIDVFGELVKEQPNKVLENLDLLIPLKPHFLYKLFESLADLWKETSEVDWQKAWPLILTSSIQILKDKEFWQSPLNTRSDAFIGNSYWVSGSISRLLEAGCKTDDKNFGIENVHPAGISLKLSIENLAGEDFEETSDAVFIAINSPRGRALEALITLALFHSRNSAPEDHANIWSGYEPVFTAELGKSHTEFEFVTLLGMYLPQFEYLSSTWVADNLHRIFNPDNRQSWLCVTQGFTYSRGFLADIYLHLRKHQIELILDDEAISEQVKERYLEHIVVAYFRGIEKLDEENLVSFIIKRNEPAEIGHLVWFISTIRNNEDKATQQAARVLVDYMWPRILANLDFHNKRHRRLASYLSQWSSYIERLDGDHLNWALTIAPYVGVEFNSHYLVESLARLSEETPLEAGQVWQAMLEEFSPDHPEQGLKLILQNLVNAGEQGLQSAIRITDLYLRQGSTLPGDWLRELLPD